MNAQLETIEETESQQEDVSSEVIAEAKRFGWVEKEKFRGDESDWVDAETFVQRGREINPILKANNDRLKKEIDALKSQLDDASISVKEFKKFQQEAFDKKEQEYKAQIDALKTQKKEAIELGDGARVLEIEDQIDEIKEARQQVKEIKEESPKQKVDPDFTAWMEENSWYTKDKKLTVLADAIGEEIRQENPGLNGRQFLDEVVERLKEEVPHKFGVVKRPNVVEGSSGGRVNAPKKKSYENLPPDAKAACDDFVKRGWITREEYVNKYSW